MYESVRTSLYVRVCKYESVRTTLYVYESVRTILYVRICTYESYASVRTNLQRSLHELVLARAGQTAIHKTAYLALFLGMVIEMARKCAKPHRCVFSGYSDGISIHTSFQRGSPGPDCMYSRFAAVATKNGTSARNATLVYMRCLDPNTAVHKCAQLMPFR